MAHQDLFLAIDQGGQSSRALVFRATGELILEASQKISTRRPGQDRVEHEPEEVVVSVQKAVTHALRRLGAEARFVKRAGLATQRSSIVFWNVQSGNALTPIISWQDRRAKTWLDSLSPKAQRVHELTGLVLSPHYGASKLRWCLDHCDGLEASRSEGKLAFGPLVSFLLFKILRERPHLVDPANASRTLLWDYRSRDWSEELLGLFGVPRKPLPRCVSSRHDFGHLTRAADVPLTVATGDQSAALFAFGTPEPGTAFVNMGTGAFLQCVAGKVPVSSDGLLSSVVWQDENGALYVLEGTVNGAASALKVTGRQMGITQQSMVDSAPQWLDEIDHPPLFLNGISGLGSPFWIPTFVSEFVGHGTKEERTVAVYESMIFLLKVNLEAVGTAGLRPAKIVATGGLASLGGLCQRLSDLSGLRVERPTVGEATARGVAFLAAGAPPDWKTDAETTAFDPRANAELEGRFHRWRNEMARRLS